MNTNQNAANKQRTIFIVVTVLLLGIIGFLLINNSQKSKQLDQQTVELDDAEKLQMDLEKQYYDALSELEQQRGTNEQLNAMIESQKEELKQQKDQISQLIRTKGDLDQARSQMKQLRVQVDGYLAELENLKAQNEELTSRNSELTEVNTQLGSEIQRERMEKEDLASAKAALTSEKERLESNNMNLTRKVTRASMVPVSSIEVTGVQVKESGKERKKKRASSVDRLKICFSALENKVTDAGYERFYIRVISPLGETIAVDDKGSGTFISGESNEQLRYTQIQEIEYSNAKAATCLNWDGDGDFAPGDYKIEIYNKGYLAGQGTFKLK